MSVHRFKPSRGAEVAGRGALVVVGLVLISAGIALGCVIVSATTVASVDSATGLFWLILIAVAFVTLAGITFVCLAFVGGRDVDRGASPHGWPTVSRSFDALWHVASEVMRRN